MLLVNWETVENLADMTKRINSTKLNHLLGLGAQTHTHTDKHRDK